MDFRKIFFILAFLSLNANAGVELKSSDNGELLVNSSPVLLTKHIYNENGTKVENVSLIYSTLKDAYALVTLNGYTLILNVKINGTVVGEYGNGNGLFDFQTGLPIEGGGGTPIYNESLDTIIGITTNSNFYPTQAVYLKQDNFDHGVYIKGSDIEGTVSFINNDGTQTISAGISGINIEYNQSLTDAVDSLITTLDAPLFIK